MLAGHKGPCFAGVDVGKVKHVVIGVRTKQERIRIIKTAIVGTMDDVGALLKRYNVKFFMGDIRPYEEEMRRFVKSMQGWARMGELLDNTGYETMEVPEEMKVKINRTLINDLTHRMFSAGQVELPRRCPDLEEYCRQVCWPVKRNEVDKKTGASVFRYSKRGKDHFRYATNFAYLAAQRCPIVVEGREWETSRPQKVKTGSANYRG